MACEEFRDAMLDVLYAEAGPADAGAWEAHERGCAPCREELRALRGLRRDLAQWQPPVGRGLAVGAPGRRSLAAAAAVVAAAATALALAGTEVRVAAGGVTIRIGRADDAAAAALRAQAERHRVELAALSARQARPAASEAALGVADVRRLIRESEARQAVLIDAGLRDLAERTDAQRRQDLAQISAGLSYVEGRTGLQVARTTELMGHVLQAAQQK
jgi:hypothetical protein